MEHCAIEQDWKNLLRTMVGVIVISLKDKTIESFFVEY